MGIAADSAHVSVHGDAAHARALGRVLFVTRTFVNTDGVAAIGTQQTFGQIGGVVIIPLGSGRWHSHHVPFHYAFHPIIDALCALIVVGHQLLAIVIGIHDPRQ